MKKTWIFLGCLFVLGLAATGQQTGSISGKVVDQGGQVLPGVVVNAAGDVLPQPRTAITDDTGAYRLRLLPPGNYELTFQMTGMATVKKTLRVLLQQNSVVDVTMQPEGTAETITVMADVPIIDTTSAELKAAIDSDIIDKMPVGQEYQDLIKLIPGVQYTEDGIRGPSAGGNGQDNVYMFDGVNVSLPLYGTLASDPSSHDIEQVAVVKGGAKALNFNRSGGFAINSISKSGTNTFSGEVSYQIQDASFTADLDTGSDSEFERDKDWAIVSIGGPIIKDRLFFYASGYRPTTTLDGRTNNYGIVPDSESERNEIFAKLSFSPTDSLTFHASYRDADTEITGLGVSGDSTAGTASNGSESTLTIAILEGDWIINDVSSLSFKYTDFDNPGTERPDTLFDFPIYGDGRTTLNVNSLDQQGYFSVPLPIAGLDDYNAFVAPLIDQYGYIDPNTGLRTGGGVVGGDYYLSDNDFYRSSYQFNYNYFIQGETMSHDLHFGYQAYEDSEDLKRESNGWGIITVPGGRDTTSTGEPIYYQAQFYQQSLLDDGGQVVPTIHSEFVSQNIEINDTMTMGNWTFNAGLMFSNDEYYGQGLRPNASNVSGFELASGHKYKQYEVGFEDMIQPRLGIIWNYQETNTIYANYAKYYPAASSLPRAASWDRNLAREIYAYFDAQGNLLEISPLRASSGKFFVEDMNPRSVDEYLIGASKKIDLNWTMKAHVRYRYAHNFWEDTNNNARSRFGYDEDGNLFDGIPTTDDYIPELQTYRDEVGGSSYVIAELDNSFTKYYEVNLEAERNGEKTFFKGSYVWSHYYGNFDQDNTTAGNDANIFIGSSYLADGAGRQLWNYRYGNLRGDRRHQLKLYGYYKFNWDGNAGFFFLYQSGQPWEMWSYEPYTYLTGSTSDTSRYAEPAGSNTTDAHHQLDFNYTHNFKFANRLNLQLRLDVYNVYDNQTGYNIQNRVHSADYGEPRSYFDPQRYQLAIKFQF